MNSTRGSLHLHFLLALKLHKESMLGKRKGNKLRSESPEGGGASDWHRASADKHAWTLLVNHNLLTFIKAVGVGEQL